MDTYRYDHVRSQWNRELNCDTPIRSLTNHDQITSKRNKSYQNTWNCTNSYLIIKFLQSYTIRCDWPIVMIVTDHALVWMQQYCNNHVLLTASDLIKKKTFSLFPSNIFRSLNFFLRVINPFPHNDAFWQVWETSLLKTLWEKEKLLVQAISPFPTLFSTLSKTEIIIFVTFNLHLIYI